jgi:hypothetical protein
MFSPFPGTAFRNPARVVDLSVRLLEPPQERKPCQGRDPSLALAREPQGASMNGAVTGRCSQPQFGCHVYDVPGRGIFVDMDARHERVSRNEAMFRSVNREIEQASEQLGEGRQDRIEVICECGQDGCSETFELTLAEYDDAHAQRDRFVITPGHEDAQIERVVARTERYLVVDKFGEAERIAKEEERREGTQ